MPKSGRPSKSYRDLKQPYTRIEYIGRLPSVPDGLRKMTYGKTDKLDFPAKVWLVAEKEGQISARALDSMRATIHRELRALGEEKYRFQILKYPHHIVRMHGLVGIAKAERLAKGMKEAFGTPQYRMAQVRRGDKLLEIATEDNPIAFGVCKKALSIAMKKIPLAWKMVTIGFSDYSKQAQVTLPKRTKEKGKGGEAPIQREV